MQKRFTRIIPGIREIAYVNRPKNLVLPFLGAEKQRGALMEVLEITSGLKIAKEKKITGGRVKNWRTLI